MRAVLLSLALLLAGAPWPAETMDALAEGAAAECTQIWWDALQPKGPPAITVRRFADESGVAGVDILELSKRVKQALGAGGRFKPLPPEQTADLIVQGVLRSLRDAPLLRLRMIRGSGELIGACEHLPSAADAGVSAEEPPPRRAGRSGDRAQWSKLPGWVEPDAQGGMLYGVGKAQGIKDDKLRLSMAGTSARSAAAKLLRQHLRCDPNEASALNGVETYDSFEEAGAAYALAAIPLVGFYARPCTLAGQQPTPMLRAWIDDCVAGADLDGALASGEPGRAVIGLLAGSGSGAQSVQVGLQGLEPAAGSLSLEPGELQVLPLSRVGPGAAQLSLELPGQKDSKLALPAPLDETPQSAQACAPGEWCKRACTLNLPLSERLLFAQLSLVSLGERTYAAHYLGLYAFDGSGWVPLKIDAPLRSIGRDERGALWSTSAERRPWIWVKDHFADPELEKQKPTDVWLASRGGELSLLRFDGKSFDNVQAPKGLRGCALWGEGPGAGVYLACSDGALYQRERGSWKKLGKAPDKALAGVVRGEKRELYALAKSGQLHRYDGKRWSKLGAPLSDPPRMLAGGPAGLFASTGAGRELRVARFDGARWVELPLGLVPTSALVLYPSPDGGLWIGYGSRLLRWSPPAK